LMHCESMRMHWDVFRDILVVCSVVWMYVKHVVAMQNDDARHDGSLGPIFTEVYPSTPGTGQCPVSITKIAA
jgi:hypothetical protein